MVHAETSTGVLNPIQQLAAIAREHDALVLVDAVTSLGGHELDLSAWDIDACYSCTQKCLGAPPGLSPIALSPRAVDWVLSSQAEVPFSLDLLLLIDYWVERPPTYHHTAPILQIYALHEALRRALEEGIEARWRRHHEAGAGFAAGAEAAGLHALADEGHRLAPLTAVRVPDGVDGKAVQRQLVAEHGMEVGGALGPGTPPIWRIGLMGPNATHATAEHVLETLAVVLERHRDPYMHTVVASRSLTPS